MAVSLLGVIAIIGGILVLLILIFLIQIMITPGLITGALSIPQPQPCINGQQWVLYDCKPHALTGLGCIVPGSRGKFITSKTIAVHNGSCVVGERIISWHWTENAPPGVCRTSSGTCCNYDSTCTRQAQYLCTATGAGEGGENQCTPQYLPVTPPDFDGILNDYSVTPLIVEIPCRENYCK